MVGFLHAQAAPTTLLPQDCSETEPATGSVEYHWGGNTRKSRTARLAGVGLLALLAGVGALLLASKRQVPDSQALAVQSELEIKGGCKSSKQWCEKREVGLLCFSQIVSGGPEEELIKLQLQKGISIFACDDYLVTCAEDRLLGQNKDGEDVRTVVNSETGKAKMGSLNDGATTNSFLNVLIFMKAWDIVIDSNKVWEQDWTVKVDPDAVFFPPRMRDHVKSHTGDEFPLTYTLNCREKHWKQDDKLGNGHFYVIPKLYGALEAFNKKALGAYKDCKGMCKKKLKWQKWGEDLFMRKCMDLLEADKLVDFEQVGDHRCPGNPTSECVNANRPAYHPYKDIHAWFKCYNDSMGIHWTPPPPPKPSSPHSSDSDSHSKPHEQPKRDLPKDAEVAGPWDTCGGKNKKEKKCEEDYTCVRQNEWFWQCLQVNEDNAL